MPRAFAKDVRDYITDYIKFGDAKAGAILTLALAAATILGGFADKSVGALQIANVFVGPAALFAAVFVVATTMTLWHLIAAIGPRTDAVGQSLASFPDIAVRSVEDYEAAHNSLSDEAIAREFARLNVQLAKIAKAKFGSVSRAIWWLRIQLLSGYVLFLLLGFVRILAS